ncbi:Lipolytic enzyme, G-D-S-L family [Candidatus Sulfopaludibacter sp. SbA3]|nr:Lipolytic enzyme, G-D-S-L family [Candidatus Sulfopaludibacter sp. SbA3]
MKKVCLFALAAALCGCRQQQDTGLGAGAVGPGAEAPKAAPAVDSRPEIACFGDSLTAGLGLEAGQSFPDLLQQQLDRRGYHYRVANFGVSGDTTQDGLARLPLLLADKPALVVLELGANDGLRGQPVDVTRGNLAQIIESLQQAGARVVLAGITLPPNYGPTYIAKFQALYPDLAAKYKLPLIPFLLDGVGGNDRLMQRDGLHPNAAGARIVAATVLKTLEPLLEKR